MLNEVDTSLSPMTARDASLEQMLFKPVPPAPFLVEQIESSLVWAPGCFRSHDYRSAVLGGEGLHFCCTMKWRDRPCVSLFPLWASASSCVKWDNV